MKSKITIFSITLLLLVYARTFADNTLTIVSTQSNVNDTAVISITMENDSAIVAFQLDIPLDNQLTYIDTSAFLNTARITDHVLKAKVLDGDTLRIFGYSNSNAPFIGNSGTIVTFKLHTGTIPGNYQLIMHNPVTGDTSSANLITGHTDGAVTILGPNISLSADTLNFWRVPLLDSADRYLTINNLGNQTLDIQSISFDTLYFSVVGNATFSVSPGQSHQLTVRFKPIIKGTFNNSMTIVSNDYDEPSSQTGLKAVAYPVNELHTGSLSVYSGDYAVLNFTMNNMEPIVGVQFDLTLPEPVTFLPDSLFLSSRKSDHTLSANLVDSNVLRVVAYSQNNNYFSGNEGDLLQLGFNIKGTGSWYDLNISNVVLGDTTGINGVSAYYSGSLEIAAADISASTMLDFGNVSVFDTLIKVISIDNWGGDTLKITSLQFDNSCFRTQQSLPVTILPWQSFWLPVTFGNSTEDTCRGILKIFSNDPDESPYKINLSGYAYIPNYISVKDSTYDPVDTFYVDISVNNFEPFTAFQFDLHHTDTLTCLINEIQLGQRVSDHSVNATKLDSTIVRLVVFSLSNSEIADSCGTIISIPFIADSGIYGVIPLSIDSAILGNDYSEDILWGINNGSITLKKSEVPGNLLVQNVIVYNDSTECYNATNTITVAGSGTTVEILTGGESNFIAGHSIFFKPGFHAYEGSYMHGHITITGDYCSTLPSIVTTPDSLYTIPELNNDTDPIVNIYPNPTTGRFIIDFMGEVTTAEISIMNLQGNILVKKKCSSQLSEHVDMSNLTKGMYIIIIKTQEKIITKKIIKNY